MQKINFKNQRLVSYLNLALCILLWSSIPVTTKKLLMELDNIQILFYSTFLSLLVMIILLLVQKKDKLLSEYKVKDYKVMFGLGLLGNYLYYILLYGALNKTTASEGFILAYTWPMLILILSFIILKQKVTLKKLLGITMGFLGIVIITTKGNISHLSFTNIDGDLLAIGGALTFALFSVLGKKYNYDKVISVFVYFLSAQIFLFPTIALLSEFKWPSLAVWPLLIYNGIFVNGVSYVFWFKALEHGETHIISNLLYLTPFLSLVYIAIFLHEKILITSIIGLIIVVMGILLQYIRIGKGEDDDRD